MKILVVFAALLLGSFAVEQRLKAHALIASLGLDLPNYEVDVTTTSTVETMDAELEKLLKSKWQVKEMVDTLTIELGKLKHTLIKLEAAQSQLKSKISFSETKITRFKAKGAAIKVEAKGLNAQAHRINKKRTHLKGMKVTLSSQLSALSSLQLKYKAKKKLVIKASGLLKAGRAQLLHVEKLVKKQIHEVREWKLKIKTQEALLKKLRHQLKRGQKSEEEAGFELNVAEENVVKQRTVIKKLKLKIKADYELLRVKEAAVKRVQGIIRKYKKMIAGLNAQINALLLKIKKAKGKISHLRQEILKIKGTIQVDESSLRHAKSKLRKFKQTVVVKKANLAKRKAYVKRKLIKIKREESNLSSMEITIKKKRSKLKKLRITLKKTIAEVEQLESNFNLAVKVRKTYKLKVIRKKKLVANLKIKIAAYAGKLRHLWKDFKAKKASLRVRFMKWRAAFLRVEQTYAQLDEEELSIRARIKSIQNYITEKKSKKEGLVAELGSLETQIATTRARVASLHSQRHQIVETSSSSVESGELKL